MHILLCQNVKFIKFTGLSFSPYPQHLELCLNMLQEMLITKRKEGMKNFVFNKMSSGTFPNWWIGCAFSIVKYEICTPSPLFICQRKWISARLASEENLQNFITIL